MIRIHDDLTETVTTVVGDLHKKLYEFDQLKKYVGRHRAS